MTPLRSFTLMFRTQNPGGMLPRSVVALRHTCPLGRASPWGFAALEADSRDGAYRTICTMAWSSWSQARARRRCPDQGADRTDADVRICGSAHPCNRGGALHFRDPVATHLSHLRDGRERNK
jgi:hypothetical protein